MKTYPQNPNPHDAADPGDGPQPCACFTWARVYKPGESQTNHHPRCPRVDDSLIEVWRVHEPETSGGCIFDKEADAVKFKEGEMANGDPDFVLTITKDRMHREIFEKLGEFDGF